MRKHRITYWRRIWRSLCLFLWGRRNRFDGEIELTLNCDCLNWKGPPDGCPSSLAKARIYWGIGTQTTPMLGSHHFPRHQPPAPSSAQNCFLPSLEERMVWNTELEKVLQAHIGLLGSPWKLFIEGWRARLCICYVISCPHDPQGWWVGLQLTEEEIKNAPWLFKVTHLLSDRSESLGSSLEPFLFCQRCWAPWLRLWHTQQQCSELPRWL